MPGSLTNCRVVLVRPEIAGNIGATARAMRNFGLTDLVLVQPKADHADRQARQMATHGEAILDRARVVPEFGAAVADCLLVAATSARVGGLYRDQTVGTPDEVLPRLVGAAGQGPVALVFGPEPSGLTNEEVSRCHFLIHIPAQTDYPVLNLAQAVVICLYELRRCWPVAAREAPADEPPAPFEDQERMFVHLRRALEAVHFLYGDKADPLMHAVRHLLGKARPTVQEVKILHGLARQLDWVASSRQYSVTPRPERSDGSAFD